MSVQLIKKVGNSPKDQSKIYYPVVKAGDKISVSKLDYTGNTVTKGEVFNVMDALQTKIIEALHDGKQVELDGIGTFKLAVKGGSYTEKKKLTVNSPLETTVTFTINKDYLQRILSGLEYTFKGENTDDTTSSEEESSESGNQSRE